MYLRPGRPGGARRRRCNRRGGGRRVALARAESGNAGAGAEGGLD